MMGKLIHTGFEIGYQKAGALDYFHDGTDNQYLNENQYKVVAIRGKEITDELDDQLGLKDYLWRIEVFEEVNNET